MNTMFYIRTAVVFALFAQYVESFDIKTQKFNTNTNRRIVQNGAQVHTGKAKSRIQCAIMCTSDSTCCSSTYDQILEHCSLFLACCPTKEPSTGSYTSIKTPNLAKVFSPTPTDCSEFPLGTCTGVHTIQPENCPTITVFCDMDTDGGGWTTIQRRFDGSIDFYRDWEDYKLGFGDIAGEHWLGNDNLHCILRQQKNYQVRFELEDVNKTTAYAVYDTIFVGSAVTDYQLTITGYSGTAGDSMNDGNNNSMNGMMFSTRDKDNDLKPTRSCSDSKKSGWWHAKCTNANINGELKPESDFSSNIHWKSWRKDGITKTRMMIKQRN
ncbi:ficolin-2-like [Mytilus californianus]|uniref:ficolin-2-like n=1 Tax=Mytilus californianus TaxID=6549 RepID=UPI0022480A79|nr:ficolin-2-like [Mytilus californianus]